MEEIFITEYWYIIRLKALSKIAEHYPKFAYSLFNYISSEETQADFLKYILNHASYEDVLFLTRIINDPLIKLYIYMKKRDDYAFFKINLQKRELTVYTNKHKLIIGDFKELKCFKTLRQFTEKEIIEQPINAFRWIKVNEKDTIYEDDPEEHYPVRILYQEKNEDYLHNYCIKSGFIENLIESIKKVFVLKTTLNFNVVKTTIIYLILKIEEIKLYFRFRLMKYTVEQKLKEV